MEKDSVFITTPIYYVNDKPHIGHAYTTIVADTLARVSRAAGRPVVFVTGTDENSQKTVDAAAKNGEEIVAYTDRLAAQWKSAWETLAISNTDFIRTTEARHRETVWEIWKKVEAAGDIYKGTYEGLYCTGCEDFKKPSDLVDGLCPLHKKEPEVIAEENYFFRLSKYQQPLLDFYANHPDFVLPEHRFREVISFVEHGLEDISISREKKSWGIPVPGNPDHVIYVWFDALINYVSAVGIGEWSQHPADIQVVGKDILRFHAVIWPAMLLSAGLPLPGHILANGFFSINGEKISKSLGNSIDPLELAGRYGVDALRYFLLREIALGEDGDFSREKFENRYQDDLQHGLGNFAARVLALGAKYESLDAASGFDPDIEEKTAISRQSVSDAIDRLRPHEALAAIWDLITFGDRLVNEKKPWENGGNVAVITQLALLLEAVNDLITPFLPETAAKIASCISRADTTLTLRRGEALFPAIESEPTAS